MNDMEEKLKLILNSTIEGMYGVDVHGRCTFVNKSFLNMLGYEEESYFIGKNIHDIIHHHKKDGSPYPREDCAVETATMSGKQGVLGESTLWRKDGTCLEVEFSSNPQYKDNKIIGAVITFKDISERIKAEKKLFEEKELANKYLDIAGVMVVVLNSEGIVTLINQKGCDIIELDAEDIIGTNWIDNYIPEENRLVMKKMFKDSFSSKNQKSNKYENTIITAKNEEKLIKWTNVFLYDEDNNKKSVISSGEDITELRLTNKKLQASEEKFRNLFVNAPFGYQSLDENGCFIEVNNKWLEIFGYKKEDVIGKEFDKFLAPDFVEPFKKRFQLFKEKGKIHSEFSMKKANGSIIPVAFDGNIAYTDKKQFIQTHCVVKDITEINIMSSKLEYETKLAQKYFDIAEVMIVVLNTEGNIVLINPKGCEILGLEEADIVGKNWFENFIPQDQRAEILEVFNSIFDENMISKNSNTNAILTSEGRTRYLSFQNTILYDEDGFISGVVSSGQDITELKQYEESLIDLSNHDFLTGLNNRRFFVEKYSELDNPNNYPLGVMMIDVNGLKIINDAFGHGIGDVALKKVAAILEKSVSSKDFVARIGGDEFAIIMPQITQEKLEEIQNSIKKGAYKNTVKNLHLSLAIGYQIKTVNIEGNLDKILKLAENHMYRHKLTEGVSVRNNAIKAILKTLTDKYEEEKIHSLKVSQLCKRIGQELGLNEDDIKELELSGMYHDIGKISIPDAILNKPGRLTNEEFEIIKTHPEISYQILKAADKYSDLAIHALHHHERWDGKGYPSGIKGNEIPLFSRIISVADAYEAMTSIRVYKDKISEGDAIKEIIRCSGTQFDKKIAKVFVEKVLQKDWISQKD